MTDVTSTPPRPVGGNTAPRARKSLLVQDARTKRRNAAERRFRAYGVAAIATAILALVFLLFTIIRDGSTAFVQTYATIPVTIEASVVDPQGTRDPAAMSKVLTTSYGKLLENSLRGFVDTNGITIPDLADKDLAGFFSAQARADLLAMTPHGWRASAERRAAVIAAPFDVTVSIRYDWIVNTQE